MNNLTTISLPTPCSEPQRWGEGSHPPLTLRLQPEAPVAATKPRVPSGAQPSWTRQVCLIACLGVLSLGGYYLVSRFVATTVIVQGRSMQPTLQDGDRFLLNRLSYMRQAPRRGDVVVVKDPGHGDYAVKRIVAMPGESLFFKRGEVLLDGKRLIEPYLTAGTKTYLPDAREKLVVTGKDQYFVLGDNRNNSEDSRYYGVIRRDQIIGSISRAN